ncbi:hypothetical protein J7337_001783 [Fusarium musae]|uniref:Methyltransferase domain-containing protein n=1 Tax=Fusarium musae TaxID=1042133 RepID=A0A9P8IWQ8_9HYPO|nr:hypothetical protein J7337_001783 [Fusarium musae]KAG9508220.1 hypothetical protein J7337_001783 [Fusarium musae]
MAHAKAQDELQKRYEEGSQSLEDPEVEHMIAQADEMMGKPARGLIAQAGLDHSTTTNFSLLDHGCGTGLIASCLQEVIQPSVLSKSRILCADKNARFVDILLQRARRDQWINVDATVLDAQDSGLPKHSFSHVTINFAMHIIPDPAAVLRDPMPVALHGKQEWVEPESIEAELVRHGFVDVKIETVDSIHPVANAEGFLASFGMMVKWIINTYWTMEQKEQYQDDFYKVLVEHLRIKHGGKGWNLKSTAIIVTARTLQ